MTDNFKEDEGFARELDAADPLRACRGLFHVPSAADIRAASATPELARGAPKTAGAALAGVYLCGNSLGLQPKAARGRVEQEMEDWARLGVEGHVHGRNPWLPYHEQFRGPMGRVVGALEHEVVMMNSLTVNLHLLMVSFYRPTQERHKIVIEDSAFPSDSYAVASQARFHGYEPREAIVRLRPREGGGEQSLRTGDIEEFFEREGKGVALMMLGAVNYLTGQWLDMERITAAAKRAGCMVGWDLAHAAGNVPMRLHEWGADFAAWCTYKYLNSGPGAVAGAFVHERHARDATLPRLAGWWGNDPATRFRMGPEFEPVASADAWQLSNPPILALAPVTASLDIFDRVGMAAVREKSLRLTGYLEWLVERVCADRVRVTTPRDPAKRGAQLSLVVPGGSREIQRKLLAEGVVVDFREPDVIRAAPVALYNTFRDVWRFVQSLRSCVGVDPRASKRLSGQ